MSEILTLTLSWVSSTSPRTSILLFMYFLRDQTDNSKTISLGFALISPSTWKLTTHTHTQSGAWRGRDVYHRCRLRLYKAGLKVERVRRDPSVHLALLLCPRRAVLAQKAKRHVDPPPRARVSRSTTQEQDQRTAKRGAPRRVHQVNELPFGHADGTQCVHTSRCDFQ